MGEKPLRQVMPDGKIRGLGTAMAMQGSAISNCDVGSVTIKLSDEGFYNVIVGCTDMEPAVTRSLRSLWQTVWTRTLTTLQYLE